ncbi:MAG: hypothetical protein ABF991_03610 [Liquorilactobacillus hordei]|uniref:hypothetical protein n=1 Tax=Liquorilactobacillus hordei TaxID=468911 RepID=UPI0039ECDDB5
MNYKKGDKVVVEIDEIDADKLKENYDLDIYNNQVLGKLEDFQSAQEKIKMTVEEKKEFDKLASMSPLCALLKVDKDTQPIFYNKLWHGHGDDKASNQFEFIKALEHPELIEVVHEDVKTVKVAGLYLWKYKNEYKLVADFDMRNENYYFTKRELKKINELEQFKHVDLVGAWEDGE